MLVHKGGQINNVQLITGLRIAEMSQLQNCSVTCTKNGSYCENEKKVRGRGDVFKEWKLLLKKSGGGGGVRVDVNREVKLLCKLKKKKILGGGGGGGRVGGGGGGQGGCEMRSKAFVKIQRKIYIFFFFLGGGVGLGVLGWM